MQIVGKEFYAAFVNDSYHVEGDERSRTNPGHGYPAHNIEYTRVEEFVDEAAMLKWVERQQKSTFSPKYRIVKCVPMEIKVTIKVEVQNG